MAEQHRFFATTAKGMEELLARELSELGAADIKSTRAGVEFSGALEVAYRACLWSRIANRVLLPLRSFEARDAEELYEGCSSVHWSDHLTSNQTLSVDFSSSHSAITHTFFGAQKVKDAVVDQFRKKEGVRPSVRPDRPDVRINVYLHNNVANVSIDLSGESLHRRGYREEAAKAPLKENLAAAILHSAEWPSLMEQGVPFLDPMTGSGTLPIEAALIATDTAPGLARDYYGFTSWQGHVPAMWKRLLQEAKERQAARLAERKKIPPIVGYDRDFRVVRIGLANVERAGLRGIVHIEKREFSACEPVARKFTKVEAASGLVILNPPYGERLGEVEELKPLYKQIGDTFKQKFKGWIGYVFTGNPDLAKSVGLHASRRIVLFNGPIECRLLKYDLY